ncbi:SARP family transcriptional regulator, partial [Streptomyces sp. NPDC004599]
MSRRRIAAETISPYPPGGRARARLHATAGLLRDLAVTGADGLEEAREHRRALVAAAEATGDDELAARIIGAHD